MTAQGGGTHMTKIAGMPAGAFIKKAREQKGWVQQELADGILDRTTLSKLENGKHMPPYDKLVQLVERLGYNAGSINTDMRQWKKELNGYLSRRDTHNADRLIIRMESDDDFMTLDMNRQFIILSRVASAIIKKEPPGKILALIKKGLEINVQNFHETYLENYLLTVNDIVLINQMTIVYWDSNERDKAINLMYALMRNFDKNCQDIKMRGDCYPTLVYNLTSYLLDMNRYKEAIPLCDKGIDICLETFSLFTLPQLLTNKADCLFNIGDKDGSGELFKQAFYLLDAYQRYDYKEILRKHVKEMMDIEL
jgi:transcriptional regulator with XRE-family HTH domain